MSIDQYIESLNRRYKQGNATEHTFRGDLQQLLESLVREIRATNEPKRQSCGASGRREVLNGSVIDVPHNLQKRMPAGF